MVRHDLKKRHEHLMQRILAHLRENHDGLSRTEIGRICEGWRSKTDMLHEEIFQALASLSARGLARHERYKTSGHASERWYAEKATLAPSVRENYE